MSCRSQRLLPAPPVDASAPVPASRPSRLRSRRHILRRSLLTAVARNGGSGASSAYGYDAFARLTSLAHDASGTGDDLTLGFGYNPAGQITGRTVSDTDYVWTPATGGTAYTLNGLNEVTAINSASVTYDANQNATSITGNTYGYDAANRLTSATPSGGSAASFVFDPLSRLSSSTVSSTTTRYQYAGVQLAAEYDASGAVTRRYVPGLGLDGVVTAYTGSGFTTRDWLLADERGSVVALTGSNGVVSTINRYDEYGTPHTANAGRFGYTGQAWLPEAAAWNYRARAYLPGVGRFLQTDPIGYAAGANLYAYVGADPVNLVDPLGLQQVCGQPVGAACPLPPSETQGDRCRRANNYCRDQIDRILQRETTPIWSEPGDSSVAEAAQAACPAARSRRQNLDNIFSGITWSAIMTGPKWNSTFELAIIRDDLIARADFLDPIAAVLSGVGTGQTIVGGVNALAQDSGLPNNPRAAAISGPRGGIYGLMGAALAKTMADRNRRYANAVQARIEELLVCGSSARG